MCTKSVNRSVLALSGQAYNSIVLSDMAGVHEQTKLDRFSLKPQNIMEERDFSLNPDMIASDANENVNSNLVDADTSVILPTLCASLEAME